MLAGRDTPAPRRAQPVTGHAQGGGFAKAGDGETLRERLRELMQPRLSRISKKQRGSTVARRVGRVATGGPLHEESRKRYRYAENASHGFTQP